MLRKIPPREKIDENIIALEKGTSLTQVEKDAISVILQTASELGPNVTVRIVGGWVRDKILGIDTQDIDLAVENVTGDEFGKQLQSHFPQNLSKYQTIIEYEGQPSVLWVARAVIFDDFDIDVCRLRTEEIPDLPPSEEQGTPYEDSVGRDFTINSLFLNLNTMKVEDFAHGIEDMKNGILHCGVDPLRGMAFELPRVVRAFRFSVNFPFKMDDEIKKAIPKLKERFIKMAPRSVCTKNMIKAFVCRDDACRIIDEMVELDFFNAFFDPAEELSINAQEAKNRIRSMKDDDAVLIFAEVYRECFKTNREKTIKVIKIHEFSAKSEETILSYLSK